MQDYNIPGSVPILAKLGFAGDYVRTRRPFHVDLDAIDASARWRLLDACRRRDVRSLDLHAIDATSARLTGSRTQVKLGAYPPLPPF